MENICLHAIYTYYEEYHSRKTLKTLKKILQSQYILSARLQNKSSSLGFNGKDYISLCDYDKRNIFHAENTNYNSYQGYIRRSLSLIFPKDKLEIVIPKIVDISTNDWLGYEKMAILGENPNERYSDMYDEIQVKNSVPLELMTGITMPIHCMNKSLYDEKKNIDIIIKELEKIKELLLLHGYNIPIYDIDTFLKLNDEETVKTLVKYYNKKYRG